MADATPRLGLPLLAAAQAQKHVTHNEALTVLDVLAQIAVKSRSQTLPPANPAEGDAYLIPFGASGAWAWRDGQLALWTAGGWRFITARDGWVVLVEAEQAFVVRRAGAWTATTMLAHSHATTEVTGLDAALATRVSKAGDVITGRLDVGQKLVVGDSSAVDAEGLVVRHPTAATVSAHVNAGGEAALALREAGSRKGALAWQGGNMRLRTDIAAPLVLATQGVDRLTVPADRAALGIGTAAPAQGLHLAGSAVGLRLQATGGAARSWDLIQTADGHLEVMDAGVGTAMIRLRSVTAAEGAEAVMIGGHAGVSARFYNVAGSGGGPACALALGVNGTTGRSLNAAGTINAAGADFAEYVPLAPDCRAVTPGTVVGIDRDGRVTDRFEAAIAFAVVSTAPALVGGDTGGDEPAARIAFAGRVPLRLAGPVVPGGVVPGRVVVAAAAMAGGILARCLGPDERLSDACDPHILGRIWRRLGADTVEIAVRAGA
ncbi:DUF2793 domain-containing protein [Tistrella mobilis]|uniref:DUF2793 domain-containing protein n=1 Tax=Tistrella mobilis TaxID=171437 RepID=UPI0035592066